MLDELTGKNLDDYGARFNVPRQNLDDNDYRALIKAMSIIKFKGNTYNSITEALALYLGSVSQQLLLVRYNLMTLITLDLL